MDVLLAGSILDPACRHADIRVTTNLESGVSPVFFTSHGPQRGSTELTNLYSRQQIG